MTVPSEGMFRPLNDAECREAERPQRAGKGEGPQPIIPVPAHAPMPDWRRLRPKGAVGEPSGHWVYRTANGQVAFRVVRWRPGEPDEGKVIRPVTWCRFPDGREGWALRAIVEERPLYNLPEILDSPARPVVVAEGEKCAEAAATVFPDHVSTTAAGGNGAWSKTNWQPLAGRSVLLLADADTSGRRAVEELADALTSIGATVCVHLPEFDGGRDIADWLDEDGADETRARIEAETVPWKPAIQATADASEAESDDEAIARLAVLPEIDYERVRNDEAARLGIRVSLLDKLVRNARGSEPDDRLQGSRIEWNDSEPWPEPVDGAALLTDIVELIRRYVDMPDEKAAAVALWTVHTFLHGRLDLSTFLVVTSATKRCGKTLLMEVAGALVFRPQPVSGRITPAALFRLVERYEPTLLLDEADTYLGDDPDLRGIVNGSQRREMAFVIRTVGEDYEPRRFGTWCPKVISGIGDLPDTVADRSITIKLERRAPSAGEIPLWRDRDKASIEELRRKLARWTDDNVDAVLECRNAVAFPSGLHDRARDAWEVPLAIGEVAGGNWAGSTGRAYRACQAVSAEVDPETGAREMLLADIHAVFKGAGDPERLPTGKPGDDYDPKAPSILPALIAMERRPWAEWSRGRPLTPRALANLLRGFGISPGTIRISDRSTPKGYKRADFERAWERYGIGRSADPSNLCATTPQRASSRGFRTFSSATSSRGVADVCARNPASSKACGVVAEKSLMVGAKKPVVGDFRAFEDTVADASERAAILVFDGEMSHAGAERMAERQFGLEPGTLAREGARP